MKKLAISLIGLFTLSIGIYSCSKEKVNSNVKNQLKSTEFSDPTVGLSLAFHPIENEMPPKVKIKIKVKMNLWEIGKSHRKNYTGGCTCFGICPKIAPPGDGAGIFPQDYIGRDNILLYITQEDIVNGYVKLYQMQDVSNLPIEHQSFNINEDILEDNGVTFKAGIYQLDPTIGEFGGYKINFEI